MLYLKNTFGGLSRTLTDSARHSFQGPHRWWKLALYTVLFLLPGGSLAVLFFAWIEQYRGQRASSTAAPLAGVASRPLDMIPASVPGATPALACPTARNDSPACRAAARKVAPQPPDARFSSDK
jgi:hypothetical protein